MGATVGRSEVGACDLLLPELRATDTRMYANFTRVSPAEFDFLLCAVREQITGSGRWRRPIPTHTKLAVTLQYLTTGMYRSEF